MNIQDEAINIVNLLKNKDINILEYFCYENNDDITNAVREELAKLSDEEIINVKDFLENLLNACYKYKLTTGEQYSNVDDLTSDKLFLVKENVIYYLGRLSVKPNIELLKKVYFLDDDKHLKLNITFATLVTFDEEVESDFTSKLIPGSDYDLMLRSWTMAFFSGINNPYDYVDNGQDDFTKAKMARIKRLMINNEENPKFIKAMSFRLLDLIVIYLFLESRKAESLTNEEIEVIKNAFIDYSLFSEEKKQKLENYKSLILRK